MYTLVGSLTFLICIILLATSLGSTNFMVLKLITLPLCWKTHMLWLGCFLAFAFKIPLFPFHIWLPEAHVEATTVSSVILASLLLKLGGF